MAPQETNLYYLQSRYYDPEVGRFINADVYASTGQGVLGSNMFAYCLNNPICGKDPTGTLTDGQIHNSVLSAIILDYMMSGYYGLSKANTMIYYNGENIWEGFGFCDLYDIWTGEVWELKKDSSSYTCTTKYAKKQLGKYVNGRLAYYGDLELSRGGDLVFGQHTYTISDDRGTYTITYWQECQGILRYSYTFEKSHTNNQQAVQKARLACIVIAAPIVVAGFCLAGTTGAAVATIPVAVAYMLAA